MGGRDGSPFTTEDIALAENLALRSAMALDRARLYSEALSLKALAESASQAKVGSGHLTYDIRDFSARERLATDSMVRLRVCDTGIGIPSDKLERIFERFIRLKAGVLGPEAGVGLGLSISRSLARAMHGDLTVESTPGEGARFTLSLPRVAPPVLR